MKIIKKLKKLENILLVVLGIVIIGIMLDGNKVYTLSKNQTLEKNTEQISEIMVTAKNVELEKTEKIDNSILYLYKVDDTYASFIYNRSLFYNGYKLESATYNISADKAFTESFSNQIYNYVFSINQNGDSIAINNTKQLNHKIFQVVFFILVVVFICFFGIRRIIKSNLKNDKNI